MELIENVLNYTNAGFVASFVSEVLPQEMEGVPRCMWGI